MPFISGSLGKFHIGSELTLFDQFTDSLCGIFPRQNLCSPGIAGRLAPGKSHSVFVKPNADLIAVKLQAIGTVVDFLNELHHVFHGLILGELIDQHRAVIVGVGTQTQEMVDILLGESESGGRNCYALRLVDVCDLFRLG